MHFKKLNKASATAGAETTKYDTDHNTMYQLYLFTGKINGQVLDCVLDSGATVTCIPRRCVTSSPTLSKLPLIPYTGRTLLDANRNPLSAKYVISTKFVVSMPSLSLDVDLIVVDNLPYSCLVGTSLLSKLQNWGIDNNKSTLTLNSSIVPINNSPVRDEQINLVTCNKIILQPGESKVIKTTAKGSGVSSTRPITEQVWMTEGLNNREDRTFIRVFPTLNVVGSDNDFSVNLHVTNTSSQIRAIGKGTKIAIGHKV